MDKVVKKLTRAQTKYLFSRISVITRERWNVSGLKEPAIVKHARKKVADFDFKDEEARDKQQKGIERDIESLKELIYFGDAAASLVKLKELEKKYL